MYNKLITKIKPLGFNWETADPFLFCVHHLDNYPAGNKKMGILAHKPTKDLNFIKELFETGIVVPVIDKRYPLSETPEAFRYFGEGHVRGKVVIRMEHNNKI